jgi:hypothetical protein
MKGVFAMRISKRRVTVLLAALALSVFAVLVGVAWAAVSSTYTYTGDFGDLATLPGDPYLHRGNAEANKALFYSGGSSNNTIMISYDVGSGNKPETVVGGIGKEADSTNNTVTLTKGVVTGYFIGGLAYPNTSFSATYNKVFINGGMVGDENSTEYIYKYIYGGLSCGSGAADHNTVTFKNDGKTDRWVYGGLNIDSGTANNNTVIVSDNAKIGYGTGTQGIQAGVTTGNSPPTGNHVIIEGNAVIGYADSGYTDVIGGFGPDAGAVDNKVEIKGGIITASSSPKGTKVMGGQGTGPITGNKVIISGGTVNGKIYGGYEEDPGTESVTGNSVTINGGTINATDIYGGYMESNVSGHATGNSVTIVGNPYLNFNIILHGGAGGTVGGDVRTGNKLTIGTRPLSIQGVENFEKYEFDVSKLDNGETALTVANAVDLGANATVVIDASKFDAKTVADNYKVTLISAASITGTPSNATVYATDSKGRATTWAIAVESNALTAKLTNKGLSNDTSLASVAGVTVSSISGGSGLDSNPYTANVSVPNSKATITSNDIKPDDDAKASVYLYSDADFSVPASYVNLAAGTATVIYFEIVADNGTYDYYAVSVYRAASGDSGDPGGGPGGGSDDDAAPAPPAVVRLPAGSVTVNAATNTATVTVQAGLLAGSIWDAIGLADKAGNNAQPTIEINVKTLIAPSVDAVKVDMFLSDLSAVANSKVENVRVVTGIGEVMLNTAAIKDLIEDAGGAQTAELAIEHKALGDSSLTFGQRAILKDVDARELYDIALYAGSVKLNNFSTDGKLTIGLPCTLKSGEIGSRVWTLYVNENGIYEIMEEGRDYEGGLAIFKTGHLSIYAVVYERSGDGNGNTSSPSGGGGGCDSGFGALAGLLAVGVLSKGKRKN